jgi:hypothetical protein
VIPGQHRSALAQTATGPCQTVCLPSSHEYPVGRDVGVPAAPSGSIAAARIYNLTFVGDYPTIVHHSPRQPTAFVGFPGSGIPGDMRAGGSWDLCHGSCRPDTLPGRSCAVGRVGMGPGAVGNELCRGVLSTLYYM